MPLYMDIHSVDGATAEDIAKAHMADTEIQSRYHVEYLKYWHNADCNKLFCLVEAPDAESARCVHQEAHGLVAERLIEVDPDLVDGFMGSAPVNDVGAALLIGSNQRDPGVRAVMFTDMVGSTDATSNLGDDAAMLLLNTHNRIVRAALAATGGREVKHTGDGIMAAFNSAAAAVRCACQIQAEIKDHNDQGGSPPIQLRIGMSAGEPVEDRNDLFGATVQLAARLCASAEPGQILVSNVIADLCLGKGLQFADAGHRELKGFLTPVHTHAVEIAC
jgi:class 3 adenylate cyclase